MYRCEICKAVSKPGQARLVHTLYREKPSPQVFDKTLGHWVDGPPHREIEREIPVCAGCKGSLDRGVSLERLRAIAARAVVLAERVEEPVPTRLTRNGLSKEEIAKAVKYSDLKQRSSV